MCEMGHWRFFVYTPQIATWRFFMSNQEMNFNTLVAVIREVNQQLSAQAKRAVNVSLTMRNWLIGCHIAEYLLHGKDRAKYGDKTIPELARQLQDLSNCNRRQLYDFLRFYRTWPEIVPTLSAQSEFAEISTSEIVPAAWAQLSLQPQSIIFKLSYNMFKLLMEVENPVARIFYENECMRGNWSVRELKRQIASLYFERMGLSTEKRQLSQYLIGQFAAGSGKKAGEFYTPQQISSILSAIVTLDSQEPATGQKKQFASVLDFACGSGSLLLNVRKRMGTHGIGKIYGQEKNITTYNLARMNMLLHGVKDSEFAIYHGDTLTNDWDMLRESNPAKKPSFDAVVANPPFSYRWEPNEAMADDIRFKNYGLAPRSAADFAFLLHGFHYLKEEGVMAIILPHGVLFRGGAEAQIRKKLLTDGHIDTVIGLPANLFFSTGIPVCILVLKKCKKPDDVLFINASEHFEKGKRQNFLMPEHIARIIETYQHRKESGRYSRRVEMDIIAANDYNLNISRYVSTAMPEPEIDLAATHDELLATETAIQTATQKHNKYLQELGLPTLP